MPSFRHFGDKRGDRSRNYLSSLRHKGGVKLMKVMRLQAGFLICLMLLSFVAAVYVPGLHAAGKEAAFPQIRIAASDLQVETGATFEVAVWLQGFTGDYAGIQGYEVHLDFDPALLQPVSEDGVFKLEPNVFQKTASPMTLLNAIDPAAGSVKISQITTQKGTMLFAGYGKLGTVSFKALAPGRAKLSQAKSIVIKADNPGINILHTVNSPTIEIIEPGSTGSGGEDQAEQVGEAPKPGSLLTAEQALQAFKDYDTITKLAWASEAIGTFASSRVMQGTPDGYFDPGRNMTRAEFAKTAIVALGLDMKQQMKPDFTDVSKTAWYYDYVETAAQYGFVKGTRLNGKTVFRPDAAVTRAEVAAIMSRILRQMDGYSAAPAAKLPFADVQDGYWAAEDIRLMYGLSLLQGRSESSYAPDVSASRAEMAVALNRLLNYTVS